MAETTGLAFYPSETHIMPLALLARERLLPVPGEVLVRTGERVEPTQVIARAKQIRDIRIIDIARQFRVLPKLAEKYLKRKVGDTISTGDPLAVRPGLVKRVLRAPVGGTILAIGGGKVLLEVEPEEIEVRAFVPGTVSDVISKWGARVEVAGAWAEATWGCGGEAYGVLRMVGKKPEDPLRAKAIDVSCHGAIVVSGGWIDPGTFAQAQQLQVRGLIAGSMDGDQRAAAQECGFPILLTEGMGRAPMSAPIYQLLQSQNGREACINGATATRFGAMRPEIIIPLPIESRPSFPPLPGTPLAVGMRVRLLRAPYMGAIGTVTALPRLAQRADSGVQLHGAQVNLGSAGTLFVPYVNLQVVR